MSYRALRVFCVKKEINSCILIWLYEIYLYLCTDIMKNMKLFLKGAGLSSHNVEIKGQDGTKQIGRAHV